jgi:hypothetical protein
MEEKETSEPEEPCPDTEPQPDWSSRKVVIEDDDGYCD